MKYVSIYASDSLKDLSSRVGYANVDQILADNGVPRIPKIGAYWVDKISNIIATTPEVSNQRKLALLNKFVDNFDIYEHAALATEDEWKILSSINCFSNYLYVSDQIDSTIPDFYETLGNRVPVPSRIYHAVETLLKNGQEITSDLFSSYSSIRPEAAIGATTESTSSNPLTWFKIPFEEVSLYSSISDYAVSIPTYPETVQDSRSANYTQMPDLLYQYEPWQLYQSSGPRSATYEFHLHRDMWTGDHTDGLANALIRFCEAQCYPKYNGSAVHTPTVTLYVSGSPLITGVMTQVDVDWQGPLGHDAWYLEFTLRLSITEVSKDTLNYNSVMSKSLIG